MLETILSLFRGSPRRTVSRLDRRSTLRRAIHGKANLARFGDGELRYAFKGRGIKFQDWNRELADRLRGVLLDPPAAVLPCFNNFFASTSEVYWVVAYERYPKQYAKYRTLRSPNDIGILRRQSERRSYEAYWDRVAWQTSAAEYGDAAVFFLGTYVDEYESGQMEEVLDEFRALFRNRRILFVGPADPPGAASFRQQYEDMKRLGLISAEFISIPATNAATYWREIEAEILSRRDFDDVFLQAGPLATVLAADLAGQIDGRALDVGSLHTQIRYLVGERSSGLRNEARPSEISVPQSSERRELQQFRPLR